MTTAKVMLVALVSMTALKPVAEASIIWEWSFGSNSGQMVTTGDAQNNAASAGTYTITDFVVTQSGQGASLGSVSGGQYDDSGYSTETPYTLTWDGSEVTSWGHTGGNSFDWVVFKDQGNTSRHFFFGWETGNINTPMEAVYYGASSTSSPLAMNVIPEPASLAMIGVFATGIWCKRRFFAA